MAKKYQLIGYDYDRFNRGNKFQNQVVIDILDDELNNIQDIDRLKVFIEINESILKNLEKNKNVEEKLSEIESMEEKLVYLRKLGLTVEEASECLYISTRQAYRYLRRVREREGDWIYVSKGFNRPYWKG